MIINVKMINSEEGGRLVSIMLFINGLIVVLS